jgi:general secretion pathway protein F
MPLFSYKGLDKRGSSVSGTIDADNARAAKLKLKKDGIFVSELKDKTRSNKEVKVRKSVITQSVSVNDMAQMTRQLASLLKANVPLVETLSAVAEQTENQTLSEALSDIKNMVNEGSTLHKSLGKYPKIFNKIYISMCEAGEMSGTLDVILLRLAEFTESQNELNQRVRAALMYPLLLVLASFGILMFLFVFVVPKVTQIFEATDQTLPWFSVMIFNISGFFVEYWMAFLISISIIILVFLSWKRSESGSKTWDQISLKLPVIGKISRTIAVSRFARTLSTLLTGGVPMLTAMDIVRNVVDNHVIAQAVETARDNISEGESIAAPLKKSGQFPPLVLHMINIGEKTGELEAMLNNVSQTYDMQVKNEVDGLASLLGPAMIILMAGVIGGIVVSIMVPMIDMLNFQG